MVSGSVQIDENMFECLVVVFDGCAGYWESLMIGYEISIRPTVMANINSPIACR